MAKEAAARPAATIVLLRDTPQGLEVFMVVRHHAIDFASGALVFPGGRVDENDFALAGNATLCPNPDGLSTEDMAFRLAAIRETFEECGVLFARPGHTVALIDGETLRSVERTHRAPLAEGRISFDSVLTAGDLLPATDLLTYFAHWITPRQALADTTAGRFKLVFATQMNLMKLAGYRTAADAIAAARAATVVTVLPEVSQIDGTRRVLRIPLEAGYGAEEFMVDNPPAS
jgi:8-oxo-dGTP pyrophosphatase MutT (NUDIX family)